MMEHLPSFGVRPASSMTPPCPTRSLPAQVALAHHRPAVYSVSFGFNTAIRMSKGLYLLLELLVDCI